MTLFTPSRPQLKSPHVTFDYFPRKAKRTPLGGVMQSIFVSVRHKLWINHLYPAKFQMINLWVTLQQKHRSCWHFTQRHNQKKAVSINNQKHHWQQNKWIKMTFLWNVAIWLILQVGEIKCKSNSAWHQREDKQQTTLTYEIDKKVAQWSMHCGSWHITHWEEKGWGCM